MMSGESSSAEPTRGPLRAASDSTAVETCAGCGRGLPVDAPGGNCPFCLWSLAAEFPSPCPTSPSSPPDAIGDLGAMPRRFASYELLEAVARGGMGVVWRARQEGLGRQVALKTILSGQLAHSHQVVRFAVEARAAARLEHPNIVPIYEVGEEDGRHFYTMRWMEGGSLATELAGRGPLSPQAAARRVASVARAIHYAHQRGVLHLDIKPSNILLDAAGEAHIADFGLARLDDVGPRRAAPGFVAGTPGYMAPEQARGRPEEVTTAADVYALGAVLYETLAGSPPLVPRTSEDGSRRLAEESPPALRALHAQVPRDLDVITAKCLATSPERRYSSAAELADDLERWLDGRPIAARPVSAPERFVAWTRRRPELATLLCALVVVLAAALAVTLVLLARVREESESRAATLRAEEGQRLAYQSLAIVENNPGQGLLLALEAEERFSSPSTRSALLVALEACHEQRRFFGHESSILLATFSADGSRVATAAFDGTARIWDARSGETVAILRGHSAGVLSVCFSPDAAHLVTASRDGTARIWDAVTGEVIATLAISDGDTPEGDSPRAVESAIFSPLGERVLTVGGGAAHVWHASTGALLQTLSPPPGPSVTTASAAVTCARFQPDGTRVATGLDDGRVLLWNAASGDRVDELGAGNASVLALAFSADGTRIAASAGREARVFDAVSFAELGVMLGHEHEVYSVDLSADGRYLATGSEDFSARIWDVDTGSVRFVLPHAHKVVAVDISPDGHLLATASYDKWARVWDLERGTLVASLRGHAAPVYSAEFSSDSRYVVTASVDYSARLWRVWNTEPLAFPTEADGSRVFSADLAADSRTVVEALSGESRIRVIDVHTGRLLSVLAGHEAPVRFVRLGADDRRILSGSSDGTVRVWNAGSSVVLAVLRGHDGALLRGELSHDGERAWSYAIDRTLRVWSVEDGSELAVFSSDARFQSATFGPGDDTVFAVDEGGKLHRCDIATGASHSMEVGGLSYFTSVDYASRSQRLVATSRTTRAVVLRGPDQEFEGTLVHPARVVVAVFSQDERWIATIAQDGVVRVWDAESLRLFVDIRREGMVASAARFCAGSRRVIVEWIAEASRDGDDRQVVIYPLAIRDGARAVKFAELSPDERDLFSVGSEDERRAYRSRWQGGQVYGVGQDASSPVR